MAGKAIFCEKPVDLDVERVKACIKVVEETKGKLMVGFNRRFDPHFMAVRKAIADGKIGAVEMMIVTNHFARSGRSRPRRFTIKRSGGIFRDIGRRSMISTWRAFLLGEEVASVSAHAAVLVDPEIGKAGDFDSVTVILETKSGKQAVSRTRAVATYGYDQRIEVCMARRASFRPKTSAPFPSRSPMAKAIPARRCMISS